MPDTVFLILNGKAADNAELRAAIESARQHGADLAVRVTWEAGDAARYVAEAAAAGASTVIAGGGDGTVNELTTALLALPIEQRPALGIVPMGTANDFARGCGIPLDIPAALDLALTTQPSAIDAVRVNDRAFLNMATGGFGTQLTVETPEEQKAVLGGLAYLLTGLRRFGTIQPDHGRITGPDFAWEGQFLVLAIGNGCQAGGGHRLCPEARLNNGLLDLRILAGDELLPALLSRLIDGEDAESVVQARLPWLMLETPNEIHLNLDGEPLAGTRFRVEVETGAIKCHLPVDCPLLD
ncbi:lipid kinase YegS [Chitinolyticbacter meiyuanensis]|uniref:lipid kinase YegS n=1 Tax=Chitinolyticbacter meiyuanensis TaxID=682798 RepID=UPI0011E5C56B|nr:lipid kinase YegS [Chitinolyticbacter meiyuanensis]